MPESEGNLVKVTIPSQRPMTESWSRMGQSAGWKKRILSSSWPSCCPLRRSNTQSCVPSPAAADESPIRNGSCRGPRGHPAGHATASEWTRGGRRVGGGGHAARTDPVRGGSPERKIRRAKPRGRGDRTGWREGEAGVDRWLGSATDAGVRRGEALCGQVGRGDAGRWGD